jgi:hypothetical protein
MEHWCKHLAIRLWASLMLGGVTALAVLPPFAGAFGPEWMVVPGLCFFVLAYWLTGIVFAAMGHRRIDRLMDEAKVWERAGMPREVRSVLGKALSTLDSFLFSPPARKGPARRLLAQTARFQMAQSVTDLPSDDVFEAYLISFPQDREVAIKWLDGVLAGETVSRQTHDIAVSVKEAHEQDPSILQRVARFFLRERCCDLTALQTYHQLIDANTPIPDELIHDMADVFFSHSRADRLALTVYLDSYKRGGRHRNLLQGIAASSSSIRPGPSTNRLLKEAESILAKIPSAQRTQMAESFFPKSEKIAQEHSPDTVRPSKKKLHIKSSIGSFLHDLWGGLKRLIHRLVIGLSGIPLLWQKIKSKALTAQTKRAVKWLFLGLAFSAVVVFVINTILHLSTPPEGVKETPEPIAVAVTDPLYHPGCRLFERSGCETVCRAAQRKTVGCLLDPSLRRRKKPGIRFEFPILRTKPRQKLSEKK